MSNELNLTCPVPLYQHDTVQLAHGGGGRLMRDLVQNMFLSAFSAPPLQPGEDRNIESPLHLREGQGEGIRSPSSPAAGSTPPHDSAVLPVDAARLAFTTDSYVVNPLFFPGGDIGKLAVCGTVNDLAMSGAKPAYLSVGFILEEGLPMETLRRIVASMAEAARLSGVRIVTGDTKVVDRGKGDGIFINTAGIGWIPSAVDISPARVTPGDAIILSGDLGRHGLAIMSVREGLQFEGVLDSDCAPLADLVAAMLATGADIHCLRDLTRGGLAAALNEIAADAGVGMEIDEAAIPVTDPVAAACELLGLDPLYVANEGRLVAFVPAAEADRVLQAMHAHPAAVQPVRIGTVCATTAGTVELRGRFGGNRIVDLLSGEQMPRIC
jgi:hydrogenase expression/formation protein HypE